MFHAIVKIQYYFIISRLLLQYLERSGSSQSSLYWAGFSYRPFVLTATKQNRAFSAVGPSLWNGLSLALAVP